MYVPWRFFFGFLYYLKECFLCFNIKSSLATTQREKGSPIEPLRVSRLKHRHWRLNRRLRHSTQNVTRVHLFCGTVVLYEYLLTTSTQPQRFFRLPKMPLSSRLITKVGSMLSIIQSAMCIVFIIHRLMVDQCSLNTCLWNQKQTSTVWNFENRVAFARKFNLSFLLHSFLIFPIRIF